jgi:hypothetical protein
MSDLGVEFVTIGRLVSELVCDAAFGSLLKNLLRSEPFMRGSLSVDVLAESMSPVEAKVLREAMLTLP